MNYEGIIFDLDGVICHTDQYHYQAWKMLADRLGIYFDEQINHRLRGVSRMESLEIILEKYGRQCTPEEKQAYAEEKNSNYQKLLRKMTPADLSAEVKETLDWLRAQGIRLAIGSSSRNAGLILERIGLEGYFDAVSDGNQITKSKPDGEVFAKAAHLLGLSPERCLVVEDAQAGLEAAANAGMDSAGIGDAAGSSLAKYRLSQFRDIKEAVAGGFASDATAASEKNWWKEAVVYQIYPRSFLDSNGDGIGDLRGVISKLDYLKELGIDVIWMSPCYRSPNDDNGYDISDYREIMDEFGTMADFKELLLGIHERGMKLMMDLVVNHTSDEHPWFLESKKSKDNPYRDYYIWRDAKDGKEPNNWISYFSGPAWEYDETSGQYYLHLFTRKQPDLNWENENVRKEVYDIMKFWLDMGCDGFRMDVANLYSKVPGLPDGKPRPGRVGAEHYQNGPRIHEFFQEMNREVLSRYDIMTVGEMSDVPLEQALLYAGNGRGELNMVFQFEQDDLDTVAGERWAYRDVPLPELKAVFSKWQTAMHKKAWNSLYWTNHDQPRTVSRRGDDGKYRKESQKMLYTMLLTMQGTPYIYQGEEIGMTNVAFDTIDDYDDVEIHNCWQERIINNNADPDKLLDAIRYRARDNARTPMQWDATENAGFTSAKPWLKVNPNYKQINVAEALADQDSILHYMRRLIQMRKQHAVAVYGDFKEYEPQHTQLYIYERNYKDNGKGDGEGIPAASRMHVVLNFSGQPAQFHMPEEWAGAKAELLISNYDGQALESRTIRPYEAAVYLS